MSRHKIVLIIGPTAVGKSSLIERALKDYPQLVDIITYTTRTMRKGESEGNPYHFVTEERFKELQTQGFFLETALVHGRHYGTPRDQFLRAAEAGQCVIADVDVQGAKTLTAQFPETVTVFILPPTLETLRERFIKRGITDHADLAKRLESARLELAQAKDFQHQIINDQLDSAYQAVCTILEQLLVK